jgi:hypothetical protein
MASSKVRICFSIISNAAVPESKSAKPVLLFLYFLARRKCSSQILTTYWRAIPVLAPSLQTCPQKSLLKHFRGTS